MAMLLNHCLGNTLSYSTYNLLWYKAEVYFHHVNLWIFEILGFWPLLWGCGSMTELDPMECRQNWWKTIQWCKTPPCLTFNVFYVYTSRLLFPCQGVVKAHDEDGVIKNTSSESWGFPGGSVVKNLPASAGGMR